MPWNNQRSTLLTTAITTFLTLGTIMPEHTMAATITASATGNSTPPLAIFPETVANGDFLLRGNHISTLVGDGSDDVVTWTFDLTKDSNFPSFNILEPLTSALLTLTLTPQDVLITTDTLQVGNLQPWITKPIQILPVGVAQTLTLNLLDYYSSSQISIALTSGELGRVPMVYADDAIVSFAKLELSNSAPESVPEPTSTLGFLLLAALSSTSVLLKRRLN